MVTGKETLYVSPMVETVEIKAQAVICQSVSTIEDLTLRGDDSGYWN